MQLRTRHRPSPRTWPRSGLRGSRPSSASRSAVSSPSSSPARSTRWAAAIVGGADHRSHPRRRAGVGARTRPGRARWRGSAPPRPASPSGSASAPPRSTTAPASGTSRSRARSAGSPSVPRRPWCCAPRLGPLAFAWAPALAAVWALGWTITTAIGVDVESQYTVFGSSGALVVTLLTAVLPVTARARVATDRA